jgi:hypothetical protein
MLRRFATLSATVTLAALLTAAGEPWKEKPAAGWTQEEAAEVLTHSPWGQEVRLLQASGRKLVEFGGRQIVAEDRSGQLPIPVGADMLPRQPEYLEAVYAVRWGSADMVQAALARLKEFSPVLAELQAVPPELSADHYILTVRVVQPPAESGVIRVSRPLAYTLDDTRPPQPSPPPPVADLFAGLNPDELRARAELRTAKKLRLKPDRAVRHGLGAGEGVSFFFPRRQDGQETLPPGTDWAEFVFAGSGELKVKFKLKEMQAHGQPDY